MKGDCVIKLTNEFGCWVVQNSHYFQNSAWCH